MNVQARGEPALYPPTVTPADRPLPLRRYLMRFVRNPLASLPRQVYEEPFVLHDNGRNLVAWVTDPAIVERVLLRESEKFHKSPLEKRVFRRSLGDGILTSQGESWRWQRRTAAPLFRSTELQAFIPKMVDAAEGVLARWRKSAPGSTQHIDEDMTQATFEVIANTMFVGAALAEGAVIQRAAAANLDKVTWEIAAALLRLPEWLWYPGKRTREKSAAEMRGAVKAILARRMAAGLEGDDLMARLARATDPETGKPMSEEQLIDNLLTFLGAGHETTAKALTWTLYLLARAPEWQTRLREEVRRVLGEGPVTKETLPQLKLTEQVFKEAMRLYPPAPIMNRIAVEASEFGGKRIAPGTIIVIPVYAIHRHRKLWGDPDRFDPTRFAAEREAGYARTQFMPFGFGPRICIGMSFAMMEGIAILATLVRAASFHWDGKHLPEPQSRVTLRPAGGMPLGVTML